MLNEDKTFKIFGYNSKDLKPHSNLKVWAKCDECGKERPILYASYNKTFGRCQACAHNKSKLVVRGPFNIEYFNTLQDSIYENMINELKTFEIFNYYSIDLSFSSNKKVYVICSNCGHERIVTYKSYNRSHKLCKSCSLSGKNNPQYGKTPSDLAKRKTSARLQGIPLTEWKGFITEKIYCLKFNDARKELIRNKYDRKCFICNKTEFETGIRLSVHHVDMNKDQGCNNNSWKLIPVCQSCHNKLHTKFMESCIVYVIELEESKDGYKF